MHYSILYIGGILSPSKVACHPPLGHNRKIAQDRPMGRIGRWDRTAWITPVRTRSTCSRACPVNASPASNSCALCSPASNASPPMWTAASTSTPRFFRRWSYSRRGRGAERASEVGRPPTARPAPIDRSPDDEHRASPATPAAPRWPQWQ